MAISIVNVKYPRCRLSLVILAPIVMVIVRRIEIAMAVIIGGIY